MLLLVAAVAQGTKDQATEAAIEDTETLDSEVDTAQANFQSIPKARDHCVTLKKRLIQVHQRQGCKTYMYEDMCKGSTMHSTQ